MYPLSIGQNGDYLAQFKKLRILHQQRFWLLQVDLPFLLL